METCEAAPPEVCALELEPEPLELCALEPEPAELWPPPELAEELDPPEEPPCEPPPPPLEPLELPPPPDECCAKVMDESRRTAATQRLESRIEHLVPTERYSADQGGGCLVAFDVAVPTKQYSEIVSKSVAIG